MAVNTYEQDPGAVSPAVPRQGIAMAAVLILTAFAAGARADDTPDARLSMSRPCYVGTSLFMLMNLAPDDHPPHFYQLNLGYQLTSKDRLSVEAVTWRYYHPLGIPWTEESRESADKAYPGHVREFGVGLSYQRSLTKGLYSSLSAIPFWRRYYDTQDEKIGNGLQLYLTARVGYHVGLTDRLFLEPSIAFNYWPISTNVPGAFAAQDKRWPSYFLFEPGLHVGFTF
jgi:hypothetical protein